MSLQEIQAVFARLEQRAVRERELYAERDVNLKILGFSDYGEYLKSDRYWRGRNGIRQRVLRRDKSICLCCGDRSNKIVHHRLYTMEVLTGSDLRGLITVCQSCHEMIEFDAHGERRNRADQEWIIEFLYREVGPMDVGEAA